jgi:carbon-monoxide dehydrogenase medium subunit
VKAAAFDYLVPRDMDGALVALAGDNAKAIAGGQSLGPMLNLRVVRAGLLVDVSRIQALRTIEDRGAALWIGASVTHSELEDAQSLPGDGMLRQVAAGIAYRAVRNRGTIGGSLAHADPGADWPLALAALDAKLHLRSRTGKRTVGADVFMLGAFTTRLAEGELIEGIEVPKLSASARWGYFKFCRKTGEFPEASAAVVLDPEKKLARVWIGALNGAPRACDPRAAFDPVVLARAIAETAPESDAVERRMRGAALARAIRQAVA